MKQIKLTQGQIALVDDEDYEYLNQFKWFAAWDPNTNNWYAVRRDGYNHVKMHREILYIHSEYNLTNKLEVDHRDRDTLNNQKSNLRTATRSQNAANQPRVNETTGFRGVSFSWRHKNKPFRVYCQGQFFGGFATDVEAAHHYDKVARKIYGEFATLNFADTNSIKV